MAIEFPCPHCGKQMRTPDSSAGKKGRCPSCGGVAPIPARAASAAGTAGVSSGTRSAREAASPRQPAGKGGAAVRTADGKIAFSCGQCGHKVRVPASFAGKKGKCPICQAVVQIPQVAAESGTGGASKSPTRQQPAPQEPARKQAGSAAARQQAAAGGKPAAGGPPISFSCPHCSRQVKTPASAAGKKGKCPHCAAVIQIPSGAPSAPPDIVEAAPDELTELPATPGPSDFGGLEPLPGANDPFGVTAPAPGSGPAADDPLGLGGTDPFADLGQANPLGDPYGGWSAGQAAANPYATPSPAAATRSRKKPASGGKRRGLPWDRRDESGRFFKTFSKVLSSPTEAFSIMKLSGGIGDPLTFAILGSLFSVLVNVVLQALLGAGGLGLALTSGQAQGEQVGMGALGLILQIVIQAACGLVAGIVFTAIGTFIASGIMHLLLMLFGGTRGAEGDFEITYRVTCYTMGTMYCLSAIPLVGMIVGILYPIYLIIGYTKAHGTDGWRATCAVLLPYVICFVTSIILIIMVVGMVIAAMNQSA